MARAFGEPEASSGISWPQPIFPFMKGYDAILRVVGTRGCVQKLSDGHFDVHLAMRPWKRAI